MEMMNNIGSNSVAVLEISSDAVRFAIGASLEKKPVLTFLVEESIRGAVKDGIIRDREKVKAAIKKIIASVDDSLKLKVDLSSVCLVLPSLGLKVFQSNHQTSVVSQANLIDSIDITNVMALVQKENIPNGTSIVDIVPDYFELDNKKRYWNAPIGERSTNLVVCSKIHTIQASLLENYRSVVEECGLSIERMSVNSFVDSFLLSRHQELPHDCIVVDFGAHITTTNIVGSGGVYSSFASLIGSDDLTETIASKFHLSFEDAERLKIDYGLNLRDDDYSCPLIVVKEEDGSRHEINQKDLNEVINQWFSVTYNPNLSNLINVICSSSTADANRAYMAGLPIVFVGGGSELFGLENLIKPALGNRKYYFFTPKVIGAREARFIPLLGMITAQGETRGKVESNYKAGAALSRVRK